MRYILGILFLLSFNSSAQVNTGARFTSLASAGVSLKDVWSIQQNQAGLTAVKNLTVGIAMEKPFAGYELSSQTAIVVIPVEKNVFGASFQNYGFASYSQQRVGISFARNFGPRLAAALDFNYHSVKVQGYSSSRGYSVEAGLQYQLNKYISLGAHVANPNQGKFEGENAGIPARFQAGGSYFFSEKVLMAVAVEKVIGYPVDNRFGLEYQLLDLLALRAGISTNPFKHYAGFGINYHKLKMDLATASQPVLGYSPQIAMSYEF